MLHECSMAANTGVDFFYRILDIITRVQEYWCGDNACSSCDKGQGGYPDNDKNKAWAAALNDKSRTFLIGRQGLIGKQNLGSYCVYDSVFDGWTIQKNNMFVAALLYNSLVNNKPFVLVHTGTDACVGKGNDYACVIHDSCITYLELLQIYMFCEVWKDDSGQKLYYVHCPIDWNAQPLEPSVCQKQETCKMTAFSIAMEPRDCSLITTLLFSPEDMKRVAEIAENINEATKNSTPNAGGRARKPKIKGLKGTPAASTRRKPRR